MISPDFSGFLRISPGAPGAPDFSDFFGFLRISPDFTGFFPDFSGFVEIFLISPGARGNNIANSVYLFKFLAIFMDFRGCLHRPGTKKAQAGHTASGGEVASQAISRTSMGSNPAPAPGEWSNFSGFLWISSDFSGFFMISDDFYGFLKPSGCSGGYSGCSGFVKISQDFSRFWDFIGFFMDFSGFVKISHDF